jgi:protoporphyrinogen oxidase
MEKLKDEIPDLVIIGGGITGLSAAYMAAKKGQKVLVIEGGKNFGGLLNTFEIGGNKLEQFYHHFFTHDIELNWLIKDLGIQDKLFFKKTSMGVFKNGKIYNFNSLFDLVKFQPINFLDKIRFGFTSLFLGKIAKWERYEHISALNWFKKWAGRSTTLSLWEPMLKIKFGPFAPNVPLSWMIGRLKQRMSSRKNGDERLGYIDGSSQVLLDVLLEKLKEMDVVMINETKIDKINFNDNQVLSIMSSGQNYEGKKYLFTIPGIYLCKLVREKLPEFAFNLEKIEYFGAICVVLETNKPLSNIYWLNIADENFPFGGIIEHTNFIDKVNYNGSYIAYLSRYFAINDKIAIMTDEEVKELMIKNLIRIYPDFEMRYLKNIFVFRTNTAATVCNLDFSKNVPNCQTEIGNMFIANMSHVYPDERSINNSIKVAMEALKLIGIKIDLSNKTNSLSGKIGF